MTALLVLSVALAGQAPPALPPEPPKVATPARPKAQAKVQAKAKIAAKPKATAAAPSERRLAEMERTRVKRAEFMADVSRMKAVRRRYEAQRAAEWRKYMEKVGPIIAQQQRDAWNAQMDARRTAAMENMAGAAMAEAAIDRQRLKLQMQEAGVPQIFVPGVGMMPAQGGLYGPDPVPPILRP